jgi:hypothetical protein
MRDPACRCVAGNGQERNRSHFSFFAPRGGRPWL